MNKVLILLALWLPLAAKDLTIHALLPTDGSVVVGTVVRVGISCPGDVLPTLINWMVVKKSLPSQQVVLRPATQAERVLWSADPWHSDLMTSDGCIGRPPQVHDTIESVPGEKI